MVATARVQAVLFDIDGTLFDWETAIRRSFEAALPDVPHVARDGLRQRFDRAVAHYAFIRRGDTIVDRRHWLLRVDPKPPWRAALPNVDPDRVAEIAGTFRERLEPIAFPDAEPALESLRGRLPLAVLTNSPMGEDSLISLGLRSYFDHVIILDENERKPRPAGFVRACQAFGLDAGAVANVGDSIANDAEGALTAGLQSVWIDRYGEQHLTPRGALRVTTLLELTRLTNS